MRAATGARLPATGPGNTPMARALAARARVAAHEVCDARVATGRIAGGDDDRSGTAQPAQFRPAVPERPCSGDRPPARGGAPRLHRAPAAASRPRGCAPWSWSFVRVDGQVGRGGSRPEWGHDSGTSVCRYLVGVG